MIEITREELTSCLFCQAVALFGEARAELLRPSLEERADQLWLVAQAPPDREEEPAFSFLP